MKDESQYGQAVPHHSGAPQESIDRGTGQAEAEGRKRIEEARVPSLDRTLDSGSAGEVNAGGEGLEGLNDGRPVGGVTPGETGQDSAGGGGYGDPQLADKMRLIRSAEIAGKQTRSAFETKDPQAGSTPAHQHSVPHHEGEGKSDAVKATGKAEKPGDDPVLLRQVSEGCEPLDLLAAGPSLCGNDAKDSTAPKSAPPRHPTFPPELIWLRIE